MHNASLLVSAAVLRQRRCSQVLCCWGPDAAQQSQLYWHPMSERSSSRSPNPFALTTFATARRRRIPLERRSHYHSVMVRSPWSEHHPSSVTMAVFPGEASSRKLVSERPSWFGATRY